VDPKKCFIDIFWTLYPYFPDMLRRLRGLQLRTPVTLLPWRGLPVPSGQEVVSAP
jgi:hypothetical protein